jgi:hypothetical protein
MCDNFWKPYFARLRSFRIMIKWMPCKDVKTGEHFGIRDLFLLLGATTTTTTATNLLKLSVPSYFFFSNSSFFSQFPYNIWSRTVAQAIGRQISAATAQSRSQVGSCGIYGGQSVTAARFFRVLRFSPQIFISSTAPHVLSSSVSCAISQIMTGVPSGLFHPTPWN